MYNKKKWKKKKRTICEGIILQIAKRNVFKRKKMSTNKEPVREMNEAKEREKDIYFMVEHINNKKNW